MKMKEDENRRLNQALEDAVQGLQKAPTQEQLAHTLTVVRRVMQAGGQWIAAVETTPGASAALRPKIVQTADGGRWWYAFMQGIILNPWHCTLQLDKTLIRIIKP